MLGIMTIPIRLGHSVVDASKPIVVQGLQEFLVMGDDDELKVILAVCADSAHMLPSSHQSMTQHTPCQAACKCLFVLDIKVGCRLVQRHDRAVDAERLCKRETDDERGHDLQAYMS